MKRLIAVLFILHTTAISAQSVYQNEIITERHEKDEELESRKHSPLQKVDRKAFSHLNYFDVDEGWNKTADFSLIIDGEVLDIMTSIGKVKQFQTYGMITFNNGQRMDTLYAYKRIWPEGYVSPYPPPLFLPFKDLTTGEETYGGGRYLDINIPEGDGEIELDFNRCYNPYCAYGGGFSCPIPPTVNFVDVKVWAGEKQNSAH